MSTIQKVIDAIKVWDKDIICLEPRRHFPEVWDLPITQDDLKAFVAYSEDLESEFATQKTENARMKSEIERYDVILANVQTITFLGDTFVENHKGKWECYDAEANPLPGQYDSLDEAFETLTANRSVEETIL